MNRPYCRPSAPGGRLNPAPDGSATGRAPCAPLTSRPAADSTRFSALLLCGLLLCGILVGCGADETRESELSPASSELAALLEEVWQEALSRSARLRLREGLPVEHLDDGSWAAYLDYLEKARAWHESLDAIDGSALSAAERVDLDVLRWDFEMAIEGERWFWHDSVLTPYRTPLPGLRELFQLLPVSTAEEREEYVSLLRQVPDHVAWLEEHVREQAERGIYVWEPNYEPSLAIVRSMISTGDGAGPWSVDAERLGKGDDAAEAEDHAGFSAELLSVTRERIDPALVSLLAYLEADYGDGVLAGVGAARLPDGEEYYRYAVRRSTTLDLSPEEIHERGVELVAEMEADMRRLQLEAGFEGSEAAFREALRNDPRFFPESPDEVGERLMTAAAAMEERIDDYFSQRPEAPYAVERLDPALEGSQTYGYYRPPSRTDPRGVYFYNGSKLDERSWLNLRAVALHELVPGHHFHIARQYENESLAKLRRQSLHAAFTEGWGSYSSYLGMEAGVFEGDPYSAYGMYVLEVFLATRLVVDTGMNLLGWSLEDGRAFMREHTLESETQIATESLRYSADMPAQALAYQMGKLKLLELRERAREELGEDFDIRAFHEAVLENGSVPMAVLEAHIGRWISGQAGGT